MIGIIGLVVVLGGLKLAGYQINIVKKSPPEKVESGKGKSTPGWRRAEGAPESLASSGGGPRRRREEPGGPGSGTGQRRNMSKAEPDESGQQENQNITIGPGSRMGRGKGGDAKPGIGSMRKKQAKAASRQQQPRGGQPGFGPSGGILLPSRPGHTAIPVYLNGTEKGSLQGKDLLNNVEDTVIATTEGPRKGWGLAKTLAYLGIAQPANVTLQNDKGQKVTVSEAQLYDNRTFVLLTYDSDGSLLLASGPKVRGTNRGLISQEDVIEMVAGRDDLFLFNHITQIQVNG